MEFPTLDLTLLREALKKKVPPHLRASLVNQSEPKILCLVLQHEYGYFKTLPHKSIPLDIFLIPLLSSDKIHKVLNEVFLPGAGGPAVVVPAPDEVDDWGEARAAEDV